MARFKYALPEEMVIEILCWLPVRTLLRFRSVCKSWLSIISQPNFIKAHMDKPNKNASLLRIIFGTLDDQRLKFVYEDSEYYLRNKPHGFEIVGSCNGIICLLVDNVHFLLWNPSTMQAKRTTKILKNQRDWNCPFTRRRPFITPIFNADNFVPVLQLYSANTDAWKEIHVCDTSIARELLKLRLKFGPVIDGILYMGNKTRLVSFDLHYEVFTVLTFPRSRLLRSDVLEFNGSVAVIQSDVNGSKSLWTLDNIHGEVSWTRKFIMHDELPWIKSYLGRGLFWGREGLGGHTTVLYDYTKKSYETIQGRTRSFLKYTETLASIDGFKPSVSMISIFHPHSLREKDLNPAVN
ncbi:hypothetical protein ACET3Z_012499 [Daucus carota]